RARMGPPVPRLRPIPPEAARGTAIAKAAGMLGAYRLALALLLALLSSCAAEEPAMSAPDPSSVAGVAAVAQKPTSVRAWPRPRPASMGESFTLMETSRSRHAASRERPRIIMYGTDARFLVAASTDPADRLYEVLEMAELDEASGKWRFRDLDMRATPARLS